MEQQAAESQKLAEEKSQYKIIHYRGNQLPSNYIGLVFSRFLKGLRYNNVFFRLMESSAFHSNYHKYMENVLSRPTTVVSLAVLDDDHDIVLGYSVWSNEVLHWVHVHKNNRKIGIASDLVSPNIKIISNLTNMGFSVWNKPKYKERWIFNPFA